MKVLFRNKILFVKKATELKKSGGLFTCYIYLFCVSFTFFPVSHPIKHISRAPAIPKNKGSISFGKIKEPTNTKTGPTTIAAAAKDLLTRPGENRAKHSGAKATAPRNPIERKLQLRIIDPTSPILNRAAANKTTTITPLETKSCSFSVAFGRISG